jgi:hypothetical protein
MKKLFFFLICFSAILTSKIYSQPFDSSDYICSCFFEANECVISFLDSTQGNFVLKQYKDHSPDEQFLLVLDALACHIAEDVNISINKVFIIPANSPLPGKTWVELPATLHSFALGISTDHDCLYHDIDIHQRYPKESNAFWYNGGKLPPHRKGLTFAVIENMAKHRDLPSIVALDTFVGNADRSSPNLFYDSITDRFCGIDMAASFSSPLAFEACKQLKLIEKINLTDQQKKGLKSYADTLKKLIENWPPEKQAAFLVEYAIKAGFYEGSLLYNQDIIDRIKFHKKCINSNYTCSLELVNIITKLIED